MRFPAPVVSGGIAVAGDSANAGNHAAAWFGDIAFHRPAPRN